MHPGERNAQEVMLGAWLHVVAEITIRHRVGHVRHCALVGHDAAERVGHLPDLIMANQIQLLLGVALG